MLVMTRMTKEVSVPDWSTGTDEEIVRALQKHYNNEIDLTEFWSVGEERIIPLKAMSQTYVRESHAAQNITMVIMGVGGKELVTPIRGKTECAFIVGQKDCLNESGDMNTTGTNTGGWDSSVRRQWCNEIYYNAFSEPIKSIFKQFKNITADNGSSSSVTISNDYFALPAEKEVFGSNSYGDSTAERDLSVFEYYDDLTANRIKKADSENTIWWLRSPAKNNSTGFCQVSSNGGNGLDSAIWVNGIAPFGVI